MSVEQPKSESPSFNDVYREMQVLSSRDWQLWSICALMVLVIALGLCAFLIPNVFWTNVLAHTDQRFIPQLFYGLITLIVLFNIYVIDQKRRLDRTRMHLLREVVESTKAREMALMDPLTGVFNRRYMDEVFPKEISKATRSGTELSFIMLDIDDFKDVNTKFGHFGGDQYLRDVATLLKKTFRGSDTVLRLGGDEFLVILPETSNKQAQRAAERLGWETRWWNQAGHARYEISLSCGVSTYRNGMDIKQVLEQADQDMYRTKMERQQGASSTPVDGEGKIESGDGVRSKN
ncbi:MAG TPA: GGDEF domain-containing protein [Terriglobales bacterium]|nr:GGDEF domain-containing protein [Terriglobales bacterium]